MGHHNVRAGKGFDLEILESSVDVVNALTVGASACCQVCICLELPVRPSDKMFVSDVGKLIDFLLARSISEAGTKLSDKERNLKPCGVLSSLLELRLMPRKAAGSLLW